MNFTAKDVQALREITGVGMMDCKKALTEANGDIDAAVVILREKGMAAAAKKAGRIAAEGLCAAAVDPQTGAAAVLEVNSETDFVAKNAEFQAFVGDLLAVVLKDAPADVDALKACALGDTTVEKALQEKVLKIGENIQIRRFARFANAQNAAYVHANGRIAVLVHMDTDLSGDGVTGIGKDVAMQAAAMRPLWLSGATADKATVDAETEILRERMKQDEKNANKPPQVQEKILEGQVAKYLSDVCLLNQTYVKGEGKESVAQYVDKSAKALGGKITVTDYVRYEVGEGLQKREENFAEEIAKQLSK